MRPFFVTFQLICVSILLGTAVHAASPSNKKSQKKKSAVSKSLPTTKLSTDIHFDDLTVRGRRQSPLGFTTAVESDKITPSLIDYRSDFRDRLSQMEEGR
jgi:hypothetical protein